MEPEIPQNIGKPIRVAILDFEDEPSAPQSGSTFSIIFLDALLEVTYGKYIPLEREKISEIVKELKLQQSDLFDEEKSKELGRLVGADAVVLGACRNTPGKPDFPRSNFADGKV